MATSDGGGSGAGANKEEVITKIADDIQEKTLP